MGGTVTNSDEQLLAILVKLEECRNLLTAGGNRDGAKLVSVAMLDVRMRLHRIEDAELKALCDEMMANAEERAREAQEPEAELRRPLLRVVK
jgi:hypothetical protein